MPQNKSEFNRRTFVAGGVALATSSSFLTSLSAAESKDKRYEICAFEKFVQELDYDTLAEKIAEMGFDGIEATVRRNGHILPEKVEDELPKMVDALNKHGIEITVMATNVNRVDSLSEKVIRTAAKLGVKKYRMEGYRYDLKRPVLKQLDEIQPVLKELVALNREAGISAVYQNHSGARYVGALLWDLQRLIKDYPSEEIGVAFDIRHATVEGGLSWPTHFNLMQPHLAAVYVKDFKWTGRKPENVPLGEGQVDPRFFKMLNDSKWRGPISLHVEYLHGAGTQKNLAALKTDLAKLRSLLSA